LIFLLNIIATIVIAMTSRTLRKSEFVTLKLPIENIFSACNENSINTTK